MLKRIALVAVVVALVLVVAPASSPVQVAYVTSGSMEPTIGVGDGFLLVPAGNVDSGDIITFQSAEQGRVTHRVVEQIDTGFITQGDANPSTDQAGGTPPIRQSRIIGEAFSVGGEPVVIPNLGAAVAFLRTNRLAVLVAGFALAAVGLVRGSDRPDRGVLRVGDVLMPLFVGAALLTVVLIALSSHTAGLDYVATDTPTGSPRTLPVGEPTTQNITVNARTGPFTHTFIDADGMTITNRTAENESVVLGVEIPPPESLGPIETTVSVRSYPLTLPYGVVARLHAAHPIAAMFGSVLAALGPLFVLYTLLYDGRTPLRFAPTRRRAGPGSWFEDGGERE
ncbi:signal peptidase I [Halococcus agarilyticus]|uniref:signal peptidase I n=1 Tax=Halococcus agarilyticus TaxID=1232219 RepID=UPI0006780F01|nr:signal peptidase I [Halococcus agarilyticus]